MHTPGPPPSWRASALLVLAVVVVDLGQPVLLGSPATDAAPSAALPWTAIGLAVGLLAISSLRRWPVLLVAVTAASLVAPLVAGLDVATSVLVAVSHAGQVFLAATVLRGRRPAPARLRSLDDLVRLGAAATACGLVAAATESFLGSARPDDALTTAGVLLVSHATSVVVLGALVLARDAFGRRTPSWEPVVQVGVLALVVAAVFSPGQQLPSIFLPLFVLVWAALRFDTGVLAAELAALLVVTPLLASRDLGPFSGTAGLGSLDATVHGALVQANVLCAAAIVLPLALATARARDLASRVCGQERTFDRHFAESTLGMLFLRDDGTTLVVDSANRAARDLLAPGSGELSGRPLLDLLGDGTPPLAPVVDGLLAGHTDGWRGRVTVTGSSTTADLTLSALETGPDEVVYSAQLLDVTHQDDARRRLETAQSLTDATLDTAACIIVVTDAEGTVVRVNASAHDITGYDADRLVGRPVWDTPLAPLDRAETAALLLWPNRSGAASVRERSFRSGDGHTLHVVWSNNVVRDDAGLPAYAVLTGIDVTAERRSAGLVSHLLQASVATALVGLDDDGIVTVFSSGATHLLGFAPDEVVGTAFVDLLDPDELASWARTSDPAEAFAVLAAAAEHPRESPSHDWAWRTSDGGTRTVATTLSGIDPSLGGGFLCVGRDVTERRAAQQALVTALDTERTAGDRLRELDRARDEFVTTVSHELRTPVTSILGYTEMLSDGSVVDAHPHQLTMLESIARNGRRLMEMCEDLALLGGFDAGAVTAPLADVDLREVVADAREASGALLAARTLEVTWAPAPPAPVVVHGDRVQLDRLLLDLLSNAVKFTEDGGSVHVSLVAESAHAVLRVADTGIGIAAEDHEAVFERFVRTTPAQTRAIQGTGLGLPIVDRIVRGHLGSVDLESAVGVGSTFTVRLPLA